MVTKHLDSSYFVNLCSVLAKILMVTKPRILVILALRRSVLAKILMVTKPRILVILALRRSVLAKILMVTKLCKIMC